MARQDIGSRVRHGQERRRQAFRLVWDQARREGPMEPLEEAEFILRRLYPELPEIHLASFMRTLRDRLEAGTWSGFRPPQ